MENSYERLYNIFLIFLCPICYLATIWYAINCIILIIDTCLHIYFKNNTLKVLNCSIFYSQLVKWTYQFNTLGKNQVFMFYIIFILQTLKLIYNYKNVILLMIINDLYSYMLYQYSWNWSRKFYKYLFIL